MGSKPNHTQPNKHPKVFEPFTILLTIAVSIVGAIIGMQLIVTLGISANTAIIGALVAMLIARIPMQIFAKYRSVHRQNLIQTATSSATFGAGNSLMLPIGIPFVMGMPELIIPMLIGAVIAMVLDATILYKLFDTKIFPATGTWPPGVATAETIKAGDEGGNRAKLLGIGGLIGIGGAMAGIPMSAFGVAFIGNIFALTMFGIGLLVSGYAEPLFGISLADQYIPHGVMIGAGIVALIQVTIIILKKDKHTDTAKEENIVLPTRSTQSMKRVIGFGYLAFTGAALLIALLGGIAANMTAPMLIAFILYAALAAFLHQILVGIAAMHSGWFPAFAIAMITLVIGIIIGFPPEALGLLAGFSAATGPAFADMGYDLKTGFILRGKGKDIAFELEGRKQQYVATIFSFAVSTIVVLIAHNYYFDQGLFAPSNAVYAATIEAGVSKEIAMQMLIWAIPGALIQWIGGPTRQMGVLFATGLLLVNPIAGWAVIAGILIRVTVLVIKGKSAETPMTIMAAGTIAGDTIYTFFSSILKIK